MPRIRHRTLLVLAAWLAAPPLSTRDHARAEPADAVARVALEAVAARVRLGDDDEALALLDALPAGTRTSARVAYLEARLLERVGRYGDAAERLAGLPDASLPPEVAADARSRRARLHARSGAPERALALYAGRTLTAAEAALAAECALALARFDEALAYVAEARAAEGADRTVGFDPVSLALVASRAYEALRRPQDAANALVAVLDLALSHPERPRVEADLRRLRPEALELGDEARYARAQALRAQRAFDLALAELEALTPRSRAERGRLAHARGEVLFSARRYAEAAVAFDAASAAGATTSRDDEFMAARALARASRDAEAVRRLDRLVAADAAHPRATEARELAASLSLRLPGDDATRRTEALLRAAGGSRAKRARLSLALALHHLRVDASAQAREPLAAACAVRGTLDRESCEYLLGVVQLATGDAPGARARFEALVRASPHHFHALFARRELGTLGVTVAWEEPPTPTPLAPRALPDLAAFYASLGLVQDAASSLRASVPTGGLPATARAELALSLYALDDTGTAFDLVRAASRDATEPGLRAALLQMMHPRPFEPLVRALAEPTGLDAAYVYGTMRTESGYEPHAVSRVGAMGLLQLMPATAARAAVHAGIEPFDPTMLLEPRTNVRLGMTEMAALSRRYGGAVPLVAAAYNAGTAKVDAWLAATPGIRLDVFLESIPFDETRGYVRRVVGFAARYHTLDGHPERVASLLGPSSCPRPIED